MKPLHLMIKKRIKDIDYDIYVHVYKGEPKSHDCPGEPGSIEIIEAINTHDNTSMSYKFYDMIENIIRDDVEEIIRKGEF